MDTKTLPETISDRLHKAGKLGFSFERETQTELFWLASVQGLSKLQEQWEYAEYFDQGVGVNFTTTEREHTYWGKLKGLFLGRKVYTPAGFKDNLIELRDKAGKFSYTIDLDKD
jgi:hypothetical protein